MSQWGNLDPVTQPTMRGYAGRPPTNPPNWHGLVTLDVLFNNLSSGLFLAIALGELAMPATFRPLASVAYPVVLVWLLADLVCLVFDLGDPKRFHHMLRVWKPTSPMSLGTWCIFAFSLPATVLAAASLVPRIGTALEPIRGVLLAVGLVLALGTAVYKGVLFSTTAQPGWSSARWMGAYFTNSGLVLGSAELAVIASAMGKVDVATLLRPAVAALILLNLITMILLATDLRPALMLARSRRALALAVGAPPVVGSLASLWLLALGSTWSLAAALVVLVTGAAVVRHEIVRLPHMLSGARPGGPPAALA
jgi:hypothetical protein